MGDESLIVKPSGSTSAPTYRAAIRWGVIVGVVNMLWLYLAYYLGLHTNGVPVFLVFMLGWLLLNIAMYIAALRSIRKTCPAWPLGMCIKSGAIVATISAVFAAVAQVGYYKVIHPAWPTYMVEETRKHFEAERLPADQIAILMDEARLSFSLGRYVIQSSLTALFVGILITLVITIFLRVRED